MSTLNTLNPASLQVLMSETIFDIGFSPVPSSEEPDAVVEPTMMFKTFGNNNKNILFIISDINHEFFHQETELAFIKTLKALKLELDDVAVINCTESASRKFDKIKGELKPRLCIFLGLDPKELGLENCAINIWNKEESIQLLYSYSFDEMLMSVQKKRDFWDAIKLINA